MTMLILKPVLKFILSARLVSAVFSLRTLRVYKAIPKLARALRSITFPDSFHFVQRIFVTRAKSPDEIFPDFVDVSGFFNFRCHYM